MAGFGACVGACDTLVTTNGVDVSFLASCCFNGTVEPLLLASCNFGGEAVPPLLEFCCFVDAEQSPALGFCGFDGTEGFVGAGGESSL